MPRFVEGQGRQQATLFPECLDDFIGEDNPVRVIDAYVEELNLRKLGFDGVEPEDTGRPSYHPSTLLKIYIYGCLNLIQSSRRLERETQRNVELFWLTGRLSPDFKTIADFRKDNGPKRPARSWWPSTQSGLREARRFAEGALSSAKREREGVRGQKNRKGRGAGT